MEVSREARDNAKALRVRLMRRGTVKREDKAKKNEKRRQLSQLPNVQRRMCMRRREHILGRGEMRKTYIEQNAAVLDLVGARKLHFGPGFGVETGAKLGGNRGSLL